MVARYGTSAVLAIPSPVFLFLAELLHGARVLIPRNVSELFKLEDITGSNMHRKPEYPKRLQQLLMLQGSA